MNENKNRVVAAEPVLNTTKETVSTVTVPVTTDATVKKPYYKHKKKVVAITATPIAPITTGTITYQKAIVIKPNWFQRQWNKFITWYNA
jgi:hypothetical protein